MSRFPVTKLLVALAMLLSIAGGPGVALSDQSDRSDGNACCCHTARCACAVKEGAVQRIRPKIMPVSAILELVIYPVIFVIWRGRKLRGDARVKTEYAELAASPE